MIHKLTRRMSSSASKSLPSSQAAPTALLQRAQRIRNFEANAFMKFTELAVEYKAVNMAQGAPDWPLPDIVRESAIASFSDEALGPATQQYTHHAGLQELNKSLADFYGPLFDRSLDPMQNVAVVSGCQDAMFTALQAFVGPEDEVVFFDPFFAGYTPSLDLASGTAKFVSLRPQEGKESGGSANDWSFDIEELERLLSSGKVRMLVLNTPHNPTGKVFTRAELESIAELVRKFPNLLVASDEVYELLVFDGLEHVRFATLPGMWERTITMSSASKTFSCTGWRIGWALGPHELIEPIQLTHQWMHYCAAAPLQRAVSESIRRASQSSFFSDMSRDFQGMRDRLCSTLEGVGVPVVKPHSGYFVLADFSALQKKLRIPDGETADYETCRFLTQTIGVATIPATAFFSPHQHKLAQRYLRFSFCRTEKKMDECCERLLKLKDHI